MRIELRDPGRKRVGRVVVDPAQRPTRVTIARRADPAGDADPSVSESRPSGAREAFLNWESALDDAGRLRRCVACGCADLFHEKAFPQMTAFIVVLAFVGAVVGALGFATDSRVLSVMAVILMLDVAILFFSRRRLVCYRCRSTYHDLPIARYHRTWDRALADRHPVSGQAAAPERVQAAAQAPRRIEAASAAQPAIQPPVSETVSETVSEKGYFAP